MKYSCLKNYLKQYQHPSKTISTSITINNNKNVINQLQENKLASYKEIVLSLVDLTEQRDTYTAGHTRRVANYSLLIGKEFGLDEKQLENLEDAAILHDIGKIVTPDSILLKPASLSQDEYVVIREHVMVGEKLLTNIGLFKELAIIMKYHHERYDGSGYPYGLTGDEIPLLSQILGLADSFDAMTTNRIYKPRKTLNVALEELKSLSGKLFNPSVVKFALKALSDISLDMTVSQLPGDAIEYQRTSYFFKDQLTGLFNKDYLNLLLNYSYSNNYCCMNVVLLKGFSFYNKQEGWEQGDTLLKQFANILKVHFPESLIFRIYGNVFVILSNEYIHAKKNIFENISPINDALLDIQVSRYELNNKEDLEKVVKMLSLHQY